MESEGTMPSEVKKPKLRLLDEVYDARQPNIIGRFNGWTRLFGVTPAAVVKFPGRAATTVPLHFIVRRQLRSSNENYRRGQQERQRLARLARLAKENQHLKLVADRFGLTVEEYLDAIS
jgi:hypothetical protein